MIKAQSGALGDWGQRGWLGSWQGQPLGWDGPGCSALECLLSSLIKEQAHKEASRVMFRIGIWTAANLLVEKLILFLALRQCTLVVCVCFF